MMNTILEQPFQHPVSSDQSRHSYMTQVLSEPGEPQQKGSLVSQAETATILVSTNGRILTVNAPAARLLGVRAETMKGQPLNSVMDGALATAVHHSGASGTASILQMASGTILVKTGNVVGRKNQPLAQAILLQEVVAAGIMHTAPMSQEKKNGKDDASEMVEQSDATRPTLTTLQRQIQNMRELIAMVPQFSHNKYWQDLLVEHMERLTNEMNRQINQISPLSA